MNNKNNILSSIPVITILIGVFFILGVVYICGYWTTFEIDPTNWITIWDVPKLFVYPFITTAIWLIVISVVWGYIFFFVAKTRWKDNSIGYNELLEQIHNQIISTKTFIFNFIFTIVSVILVLVFPDKLFSWVLICLNVYYFLYTQLNKMPSFKNIENIFTRSSVISIICLSLILTFFIAKFKALIIYNNEIFQSIILNTSSTEKNGVQTFPVNNKLIGIIGSKVILSDYNNKEIYILDDKILSSVKIVSHNLSNTK